MTQINRPSAERATLRHRRFLPAWPAMPETLVLNTLIVSLAVLVHYEMLFRLARLIPRLTIRHRYRVLIALLGALAAHIVEIWIFAGGYYAALHLNGYGRLVGAVDESLLDCVYFSMTTYTTLGFGDIHPVGLVRFLAGLEGLTGFLLITWSASFMFVEMSRYWQPESRVMLDPAQAEPAADRFSLAAPASDHASEPRPAAPANETHDDTTADR